MNDHCIVHFAPQAEREWRKLARRDSRRFLILDTLIRQIEENGWTLSKRAEIIKVLHRPTCIGEIRDVGSGGYRLVFFWHDVDEGRELWICRIEAKSDVLGKVRLNTVCDAVEKMRERFLEEE